jgi:hypothetical protein
VLDALRRNLELPRDQDRPGPALDVRARATVAAAIAFVPRFAGAFRRLLHRGG